MKIFLLPICIIFININILAIEPPLILSITTSGNTRPGITIEWRDNSTNEVGFRIYRKAEQDSEFIYIATVDANITIFRDSDVLNSTRYYYYIHSFNSTETSDISNIVSIVTKDYCIWHSGVISDPWAQYYFDSNYVKVGWKDQCRCEIGYKIFKKDDNSGLNEIANFISAEPDSVGTEMIFIDSTINNNKWYNYIIKVYTSKDTLHTDSLYAYIYSLPVLEDTITFDSLGEVATYYYNWADFVKDTMFVDEYVQPQGFITSMFDIKDPRKPKLMGFANDTILSNYSTNPKFLTREYKKDSTSFYLEYPDIYSIGNKYLWKSIYENQKDSIAKITIDSFELIDTGCGDRFIKISTTSINEHLAVLVEWITPAYFTSRCNAMLISKKFNRNYCIKMNRLLIEENIFNGIPSYTINTDSNMIVTHNEYISTGLDFCQIYQSSDGLILRRYGFWTHIPGTIKRFQYPYLFSVTSNAINVYNVWESSRYEKKESSTVIGSLTVNFQILDVIFDTEKDLIYLFGGEKLVIYSTNFDLYDRPFMEEKIKKEDFTFNAYPNPFNPVVNISLPISNKNKADIHIFNINGRHIRSFSNVRKKHVSWNASNYPSGVYFLRVEIGNKLHLKRVLLIK